MDHECLKQIIPQDRIGELKDMASQVMMSSAALEGKVAPETAQGLAKQLRLLNSYHSNLIEGHKTGILDIRKALQGQFTATGSKRYAQELCAAHVVVEDEMMQQFANNKADPFHPDFLPNFHRSFYSQLPPEHQFCHEQSGFTEHPVKPGEFRNRVVTVDGTTQLGPNPEDVPTFYQAVLRAHAPDAHHGDECLLAVLGMHHKMAWVHPFRDGNGRMVRLHTTAALTHIGVNSSGLWSLSRAFSRNKNEYYIHLQAADLFEDEHLADFVEMCLELCLDQISTIEMLLNLNTMESRIAEFLEKERFRIRVEGKNTEYAKVLSRPELPLLLFEAFRNGKIKRGDAYSILNVGRKRGGEITAFLLEEGLITASSARAPFNFGFPEVAMPYYFPHLYSDDVMKD